MFIGGPTALVGPFSTTDTVGREAPPRGLLGPPTLLRGGSCKGEHVLVIPARRPPGPRPEALPTLAL